MNLPFEEDDDDRKAILVVDDELGIRNFLEQRFQRSGFKVVTASNGIHALQVLQQGDRVDLILCDMKMPGKSGLDLLNEIKKDSRFSKIPFIMFTGQADRSQVVKAIRTGIDDFLLKPLKQEELLEKINKALDDSD